MMNIARRPVKENRTENSRRWRDKFKQQCNDRMKNARYDQIEKKRENSWMEKIVKDEWNQFIRDNEEAMLQEGVQLEYSDNLIEESIPEYDELLQQEQEEIELALATYEASMSILGCINCQKAALAQSENGLLSCPQCGFYATEKCLQEIQKAVDSHAQTCYGVIGYMLEPGTTNTVHANCEFCDLWNVFYM